MTDKIGHREQKRRNPATYYLFGGHTSCYEEVESIKCIF